MQRERAKTAAYPQAEKSKENFWTCFARADVNPIREMKPSVISQVTMAYVDQRFEEILEEEFAKIDPATL